MGWHARHSFIASACRTGRKQRGSSPSPNTMHTRFGSDSYTVDALKLQYKQARSILSHNPTFSFFYFRRVEYIQVEFTTATLHYYYACIQTNTSRISTHNPCIIVYVLLTIKKLVLVATFPLLLRIPCSLSKPSRLNTNVEFSVWGKCVDWSDGWFSYQHHYYTKPTTLSFTNIALLPIHCEEPHLAFLKDGRALKHLLRASTHFSLMLNKAILTIWICTVSSTLLNRRNPFPVLTSWTE